MKIFLTFDENKQECTFCEKNEKGFPVQREILLKISRTTSDPEAAKRLWLLRDFDTEIATLAEQQELSLRRVSLRYGELSFPHDEKAKYEYNDQFGLVRV